jgi:hypothetical protein
MIHWVIISTMRQGACQHIVLDEEGQARVTESLMQDQVRKTVRSENNDALTAMLVEEFG